MSIWIAVIGLVGGGFLILLGYLMMVPWLVAGPLAVALLGSWFLNEVKEMLAGAEGSELSVRVIRYRQKGRLERKIGEMRKLGWEPKLESYRETETGLLNRKIVYSVIMERKEKAERDPLFA